MGQLSRFFSNFGPVVGCRIDADHQRATIAYGDPAHAKAAISSPVPVLNNRFIKIYWDSSNGTALADAPLPAAPAPAPGAPEAAITAPRGPSPYQVEKERRRLEQENAEKQLREVRHQKEELRKKQLSEIEAMTVMARTATGKKKEFLLEQIRALTAGVDQSIKADQERTGIAYQKQLADTIVALEAKAGEMGIHVSKIFRRKKDASSAKVLDNRPKQLSLGALPESASIKSVLTHFKSFGLIDEINLESETKSITFATHESASKAKERGKNFADESGGVTELVLEWLLQTEENNAESSAPIAVAVAAGEKDDDDEDDEDDGQKNWKR